MSRHAKQQRRWRERAVLGAATSTIVAGAVESPEAWASSAELESSSSAVVAQRVSHASQLAPAAVARLMSVKVCAASLGCSVKTIRRMIDAGTFPRPVRVAGKLMIVAGEFETWFQDRLNERA